MLILNGTDVAEINLIDAPTPHEHEDTTEDVAGMLQYLKGVSDMVEAWDKIVAEAPGRTEAFEEWAAMIEEIRRETVGLF